MRPCARTARERHGPSREAHTRRVQSIGCDGWRAAGQGRSGGPGRWQRVAWKRETAAAARGKEAPGSAAGGEEGRASVVGSRWEEGSEDHLCGTAVPNYNGRPSFCLGQSAVIWFFASTCASIRHMLSDAHVARQHARIDKQFGHAGEHPTTPTHPNRGSCVCGEYTETRRRGHAGTRTHRRPWHRAR